MTLEIRVLEQKKHLSPETIEHLKKKQHNIWR